MTTLNTSQSDSPDEIDKIFEKLDENLSNAPGTATEIGWEAWAEQKQDYYAEAGAAIERICQRRERALLDKLLEQRQWVVTEDDASGWQPSSFESVPVTAIEAIKNKTKENL